MTALAPAAAPTVPARTARETAVDVARAGALMIVVLLHAMMVGVSAPGGIPRFENTMAVWEGFPLASWFVQVMPLFFVLGGFSTYTDWVRRRAAGTTAGTYLVSRIRRLALPALGAVAATAVLLITLTLSGVAPTVVAEAGFRISQPFWFLGVYILCTALAPAMVAAHRRAPWLTVALLTVGVLAVDVTRAASGIEAVGLANLLCVWLLVQQAGFFLADGTVDRLPRSAAGTIAVVAIVALAGSQVAGIYPHDLYAALNPPTFALVMLGLAQLLLFALARPALRRAYARRGVRRVVDAIGSRSMTIYSWHMPILIGMAGLLLTMPALMPEPLTPMWWLTRPAWLVAAGVVIAVVAFAFGRIETGRTARSAASVASVRAWGISAIAAAGIVAVLVAGSTPWVWAGATVLLIAALVLCHRALAMSPLRGYAIASPM